MRCTASMMSMVIPPGPWHYCERPLGHAGLHCYTKDTWKSDPPTRTVVEFTTNGKVVGSAVITGGWLPADG